MPKQISKTCLDCEKTIRKNQKSLTCSQCLQFKHVKRPGRKAYNNLETTPTTTADWTCNLCDFSFPFASCSEVEFDNIFNPIDFCQRWSPRGCPWLRGRPWPRGHILKSLALASKPQVLGLEALGPRKLPCPRLEDRTIF